jgi:hypothetical protein
MKWHEEESDATPRDWYYCNDAGQVVAWVCNRGPQRCYVYEPSGGQDLLRGRYMTLEQAKAAVVRGWQ